MPTGSTPFGRHQVVRFVDELVGSYGALWLPDRRRAQGLAEAVERVEQVVGRGLLLGLDLLIAAEVIRTVTSEPTLENVAAPGLLVLVRTSSTDSSLPISSRMSGSPGPVCQHLFVTRPGDAYHPRTQRHRSRHRGKLGVRDATAMAVGGMIGGGIFSVLGVTIQLAGHLAFACFVLAGGVAMITARSYAGLAIRTRGSGGPDAFLRAQGHPQLAAITSWFLVLGYILALAVYAFTFGHYVESVTGGGQIVARGAALAILAVFLAVNARGVGASSLTEDVIVLVKLLVLAAIAAVGLGSFDATRLEPLANVGVAGLFIGAGSIFVAYEGFELLSYDYDDIEDPDRNLPRALYLSVVVVVVVYVVVTIGSQMLVGDDLIVAEREVAFAEVGQEALGALGRALAVGGAVLATSSAVNATLFSTSRLVRDLTDAGELPAALGRTTRGLPVTAMILLAATGALFAMVPAINDLLAFGSLAFLGVFGLINHAFARTARTFREGISGHVGTLLCTGAIGVVLVDLARSNRSALAMVVALTVIVGGLRLVWHPHTPSARGAGAGDG